MVWTPGAGSTLILSAPHGTPRVNAEYQIVASAQTGLVVSITSTSSNGWTWIGDAIQAA